MSRYSPAEIEAMAGWLREGLSASQIAANLTTMRGSPVSRNAAIGIVKRNKTLNAIGFKQLPGWAFRKKPGKPRAAAPKEPKAPKPPKVTKEKAPKPERAVSRPPTDPETYFQPTAFECRRVPLIDLRRGDCKWPVNDAAAGEDHLFCGNPADAGVYCRAHWLRSLGQGTTAERHAGRDLERAAA